MFATFYIKLATRTSKFAIHAIKIDYPNIKPANINSNLDGLSVKTTISKQQSA